MSSSLWKIPKFAVKIKYVINHNLALCTMQWKHEKKKAFENTNARSIIESYFPSVFISNLLSLKKFSWILRRSTRPKYCYNMSTLYPNRQLLSISLLCDLSSNPHSGSRFRSKTLDWFEVKAAHNLQWLNKSELLKVKQTRYIQKGSIIHWIHWKLSLFKSFNT